MENFFRILMIVTIVALWIIMPCIHRREIHKEIESAGGEIIKIKRCFLFSRGPFEIVGKGSTVYRFEYWMRTERREGWVKIDIWLDSDWRL